MAHKQKTKSGGARKHGRNKNKCANYRAMHTREKNKLKRVLRSSGLSEAQLYARENNLNSYLKRILK